MACAQANEPASPYGGTVVEDMIARVNDQIITRSDYDRALNELNQEGRERGETMQEMAGSRKDLLRNLIDQQLWLSKAKELNITGETELVKRLDEIRKQYSLESLEDLEKAAKDQGVSYEDFKANIRNQIVTQEVMRQEVGARIQITPGEAEHYYEAHKQDYVQPESERLSEILISTGTNGTDDPAKVAAAKAKADDIEAKLRAGGDFAQLARTSSDGSTAGEGGDLGQYKRGQLNKVLEDQTFNLKTDEYTAPILTRQGYIILKVVQHTAGGPKPYKDVQEEVEEAYFMTRMEPAIRAYLTKMREDAYIDIKPGYTDSGASPNETKPVYSAYVPPAPKKKAKVERTRFRESTHTFRQKSGGVAGADENAAPTATPASAGASGTKKNTRNTEGGTEKPGKREKIRFGQAPRHTLPAATADSATENAGAVPETASNAEQPANPLEPAAASVKTRFSERARTGRKKSGAQSDSTAPAPDAAEVADRQTQSAPLGLAGDTSSKKRKKSAASAAEKTRLADKKKSPEQSQTKPVQQPTPIARVPGAPAPADAPKPQPDASPQAQQPPASQPQQ